MAALPGNPDFDLFTLPDEHKELRAVLRDLCEKEIAPYAADVDEKARYTDEALAALTSSGFAAIHIPEEYGGQGGDAVAGCIVIEEVARVCASSSLIPICNKLGTVGMLMRGSEELKKQVLPSIAAGEAVASYALSEREAGSDAASMRTRARAEGDEWVLNGAKCWISNGGHSTWYTVMAVTEPDKGANGISAFVVHKDDPGFVVGAKEKKLGIKGSPTTELYFEDCRIPGDRIIGEPGTGFKTALATLDHQPPALSLEVLPAQRAAYFCSGCPHNRSTAVPEGSLAGGGIGCHAMVTMSNRKDSVVTGLTQMGGEGASGSARPHTPTGRSHVPEPR